MKLVLFRKYFVKTSLEIYNDNIDYIQTLNVSNIVIKDEIITFYCDKFIDIEGFNCVNQVKYILKRYFLRYIFLIITIILIISFLKISKNDIKEVKYESNSIKDQIVYNQLINIVNNNKKLDLNNLQRQFMIKYPHYAWIGLKQKGSILYLNIEQVPTNNNLINLDKTLGDLISGYDAYIKSIVVNSGKALVNVNQTVKKDELLVSGKIQNQLVNPNAVIIGEIVYIKDIEVDKTISIESYTGNLVSSRYIIINKTHIKKKENPYKNYKIANKCLFNLFNFIKIEEITYYEKGYFNINYNQEDALVYAKSQLYYEFSKDKTSDKEQILNIEVLQIQEYNNKYIIKLLVKADKNIVVFRKN